MNEIELANRCEFYFNKLGYNFSIPVKINSRLTKTWGRYIWNGDKEYLEFSKRMIDNCTTEFINTVIAHECAHAIVYLETKEHGHGHDNIFKKVCNRLNMSKAAAAHIKGEYKEEINQYDLYKYIVTCQNCNNIWHYSRINKILKNIDKCKCPKCNTFSLNYTQNW